MPSILMDAIWLAIGVKGSMTPHGIDLFLDGVSCAHHSLQHWFCATYTDSIDVMQFAPDMLFYTDSIDVMRFAPEMLYYAVNIRCHAM